jgi:hypothetical protein
MKIQRRAAQPQGRTRRQRGAPPPSPGALATTSAAPHHSGAARFLCGSIGAPDPVSGLYANICSFRIGGVYRPDDRLAVVDREGEHLGHPPVRILEAVGQVGVVHPSSSTTSSSRTGRPAPLALSKVQAASRPTGGAPSSHATDSERMSLLLRRWRQWVSPAARRGRRAAHSDYAAWAEAQRERHRTAAGVGQKQ